MTWRTTLLTLHLVAVLAGLAYAASAAGPTEDANIGWGLALLWLSLLGSPWSWPALAGATDALAVLALGGAVLNLALHAALSRRSPRAPG